MDIESFKVPLDRLTVRCDPDSLGFETTEELAPLEGTVGQDRAVRALEFGLGIDAPGYNIYVAGYPGTGRTTTLASLLNQASRQRSVPDDWCYVHNFHEPLHPVAVHLPAGMGRQLVQDMTELIEDCLRSIPGVFETEDYRERVEAAVKEVQTRKEAISNGIEQAARQQGFIVQPSPAGIMTTPLKDGKPLGVEEYGQLPDGEREAIRKKSDELQEFINQQLVELRRSEREGVRRRAEVDKEVALGAIEPTFIELRQRYEDVPELMHYLEDVREDIAVRVDDFRSHAEQRTHQSGASNGHETRETSDGDPFLRYNVNVLVDNSETEGAPVLFEYNPTYYNLFGRIEYRPRYGTAATDLTMIRPGAIHTANGGYLAVQAKDLLTNQMVWETLKRVLRSGEARIENIAEQFSPIPTSTLRPEPVPVSVKIVLIGPPMIFGLLQRSDEDFRKFFKVKADFDLSMEKTPENSRFYASFVCNQCRDANVRNFHKTAVARLVDYASRLVEHQDRLTTRFIDVADLITEADHWAGEDNGSTVVMAEHVTRAIEEKAYRSNLTEERLQQFFDDGTILIDTDGAVVGQINGMSVLDLGDYAFGRPMRITARSSPGRGQMLNIDRDAQMTGRTHNKGFLILSGYLMGKYGRDKPLSFRSSIGFEQSYDEVEGDSASSAELYVLLSSLAEIPINQGLAVTGSVNQHGEIQAIGGAIYKIEGYYDVCKAKGLTGRQGVVIPRDNIKNLVLRDDVVQAVQDGRFHIYAVKTVEEGIEVLTGVPTGEPNGDGDYPEGTLNHAINRRLEEMADTAKDTAGRNVSEGEDTADGG